MRLPHRIKLDIDQEYYNLIPAQQGDTARVLNFQILNNNIPFSLENKTVRARIKKPDGNVCYNDMEIINASEGECDLKLTNQILIKPGMCKVQLEIMENGEILSTIIFAIFIRESIDIKDAAESTNEFTALENGIIKLDEWDKYFKETSGTIEEKYTERLNGIDSSLEDMKKENTITFRIPSDFATLQEALDTNSLSVRKQGVNIELLIESGHKLTKGLKVKNGDYSNFYIKSVDDIVYLSDDFGGVGYEPTDEGFDVVQSENDNLIYGINCAMPVLSCVIDMENKHGTGYYGTGCTGVITMGCGVINAGRRGCECYTSKFVAKKTMWNGSNMEGFRMQHGSTATAMGISADDCCKSGQGEASIYISKGCVGNFREGHALRSGTMGLKVRRSRADVERTDFSNATTVGIKAEGNANISAIGCKTNNCGRYGVFIEQGSYVAGIAESKNNGTKDLFVQHGSILSVSGCITTHTVELEDKNPKIEDTNLTCFNTPHGDGMIFVQNEIPIIQVRTREQGNIIRFANGVQISISKNTLIPITITSGAFSDILNKPELPLEFKTIWSSQLNVYCTENSNGGGDRIGATAFHRFTDRTFRVKNEGISLSSASTNKVGLGVMVQEIIIGTWK